MLFYFRPLSQHTTSRRYKTEKREEEDPMKFFNTAGPINPNDHYYIPGRLNELILRQLVEEKKYFILHAPRQSGKTTAIREFVKKLNQEDKFKAFYINVEGAQASRSNYIEGLRTILNRFKAGIIEYFGTQDPAIVYLQQFESTNQTLSGNALYEFLQFWSQHSPKPILLFIDEIDSLVGDTLISVLRQLRDGYTTRPSAFPQSICLVGVRDVRDYLIWSDKEQKSIQGGSAFNIKAESLVLLSFTREQVRNLYLQHTTETEQHFDEDAINYAFEQTQGQPWLVNALAYQACFRDIVDRSQRITLDVIERAREALIKRMDTHLDVLVSRLHEKRVHDVVSDIILGEGTGKQISNDDLQYVIDLGLINPQGTCIANPIYQEIIPRALVHVKQTRMLQQTSWYVAQDGRLDIMKLLEAFTQFYRENIDLWLEETFFKEVAPHLLLMAFLQRIINGGGSINREYALGRGRVDLLIVWNYGNGQKQRIVIELKIWRSEKTLTDGIEQTENYMTTSNTTEGHLVIFDQSAHKSWDEKIYQRTETFNAKTIHVWGL